MRALLALGLLGSCGAVDKVKVQVYAEAGCPFCRKAVAGPINNTLSDPSLAAILDFEFVPFGNAYFVTRECGGGPYNVTVRECFNAMCSPEAPKPLPADCFTGPLVCQHGAPECQGNRYLACAKHLVGAGAFLKYMPFVHCVEANYDPGRCSGALASSCAAATGIDAAALSMCYAGAGGDQAVVEEAKATVPHPGVPYALVNGKEIELDDLLREVCGAYQGSAPAGCGSGALPVASVTVRLLYA